MSEDSRTETLAHYATCQAPLVEELGIPSRLQKLQQAGVFTQMTRVLHAIAARYPLLLIVDDLQWTDQDSVNLPFHLGRRLDDQRTLVVGAFRPEALAGDTPFSLFGSAHKDEAAHSQRSNILSGPCSYDQDNPQVTDDIYPFSINSYA